MDEMEYIEIIRDQLNKAIALNGNKEHILELSELLDLEIAKFLEEKLKSDK